MKKIIHYSIILFLIIYLISLFLPSINKLYIILRYSSLYLFLALLTWRILDYYHQKIMKMIKERLLFISFVNFAKVIVFGVILTCIGLFMTSYISKFETLYTNGCQYYDSYNQLIYQSYYTGTCPTLENYIKDENSISFIVYESIKSQSRSFYFVNGEIQSTLNKGTRFDMKAKTDVKIKYDSSYRIIYILQNKSEIVKVINDKTSFYAYNSYYVEVNQNFKDDTFEMVYQEAYYHNPNFTGETDVIVHHEFKKPEITTKRVYSVNTINQGIAIYKEALINEELKKTIIAESKVQKEPKANTLYQIDTNIMQNSNGIHTSHKLTINKSSIEFNLYETITNANSPYMHFTSWDNYKGFDDVVLKRRNNLSEKTNNDYKRSFDFIRKEAIVQGINIFSIEKKDYGTLVTFYQEPKVTFYDVLEAFMFNASTKPIMYPYFDYLNHSNKIFDMEYRFFDSSSSGDVIYQKNPYFEDYYQ